MAGARGRCRMWIVLAASMALPGAATLLPLAAWPAAAGERGCLPWNQPVTLEGFVLDGIFPGPPEFESVEEGDARIEAVLLYLTEPVCVSGDDPEGAEPVEATEIVQLACYDVITPDMRGRTVSLTGRLFSAHTGYHWTPALLDCAKAR